MSGPGMEDCMTLFGWQIGLNESESSFLVHSLELVSFLSRWEAYAFAIAQHSFLCLSRRHLRRLGNLSPKQRDSSAAAIELAVAIVVSDATCRIMNAWSSRLISVLTSELVGMSWRRFSVMRRERDMNSPPP